MPPSCAAFAKIPDAIWESRFDHRRAYAGDGGVRFELEEEGDLKLATRAFA